MFVEDNKASLDRYASSTQFLSLTSFTRPAAQLGRTGWDQLSFEISPLAKPLKMNPSPLLNLKSAKDLFPHGCTTEATQGHIMVKYGTVENDLDKTCKVAAALFLEQDQCDRFPSRYPPHS